MESGDAVASRKASRIIHVFLSYNLRTRAIEYAGQQDVVIAYARAAAAILRNSGSSMPNDVAAAWGCPKAKYALR